MRGLFSPALLSVFVLGFMGGLNASNQALTRVAWRAGQASASNAAAQTATFSLGVTVQSGSGTNSQGQTATVCFYATRAPIVVEHSGFIVR